MKHRRQLKQLVAEGMDVYPGGMAAAPANGRPPWIDGATKRVARNAGTFRPVSRTQVWGTGPRNEGNRHRSRQQFVSWLKREMPKVWALAKARVGEAPAGLSGLGQNETETWWQKLTGTVANIGQSVLAYQTQKELLDIQLKRAEQGLPPIETAQYQPTVRVGVDPETARYAVEYAGETIGEKLGPLLWIIPAGLVLLFVMRR